VIQAIENTGKLDNTLIIYVSGDNGSSPEGTLHGLYSEYLIANGIHPTVEENMKFYDVWGTDQTYPHYAVGWAWAWDTPYQWTKEVASHFGGTRNGMCMAWPARIKDAGGIRHQFHHVIDIVPTILEATGVPQPVSVNAITQRPMEVSAWRTPGTALMPPASGSPSTSRCSVPAQSITMDGSHRRLPSTLPGTFHSRSRPRTS